MELLTEMSESERKDAFARYQIIRGYLEGECSQVRNFGAVGVECQWNGATLGGALPGRWLARTPAKRRSDQGQEEKCSKATLADRGLGVAAPAALDGNDLPSGL